MMQRFFALTRYFLLFCATLIVISSFAYAQMPTNGEQPSVPSVESQQVAELQKVADRWDDAVGQHDQYALELVLAPQFISVTDTGAVKDRDQVVSEMVTKDAPHYNLMQKVITVRMIGDVAVVNGTYDRTYPGSRLSRIKAKSQKGVFSQVYVRARNTWECVNSQRTIIEESTLKSRKKSQDESEAKPLHHDLGFHLPGMHHDNSTDAQSPQ